MAIRSFPGVATTGAVARGTALSGATAGLKDQYICPAGFQAVVSFVSVVPTAGAATIQVAYRNSAVDTVIWQGTTQVQLNLRIPLGAGDSLKVSVSVLDAASVFDALISAEEYPVV